MGMQLIKKMPRGKHQPKLQAKFIVFAVIKENAGGGVMAGMGKRLFSANQFK